MRLASTVQERMVPDPPLVIYGRGSTVGLQRTMHGRPQIGRLHSEVWSPKKLLRGAVFALGFTFGA